MRNLPDLFSTPLKAKVVNKEVTAYLYPNGVVNIGGKKYVGYSMTEAIKQYRNGK